MRERVKHIHFVGIGGSGMSAIAQVLANEGYKVSGSDLNASAVVKRLINKGVEVFLGHDAKHIDGADVVVQSTAITAENDELKAARERNIPIVPRAEMLGELMRFRKGIAVAGTHGKTTTTSLIADVLVAGGLDPSFVVGGLVQSVQSNSHLGKGEYLIAEADESDASFLHLQPYIAIVTNIDEDHMETYGGDRNQLKTTFIEFIHNLPFYGLAIICIDNAIVREIRPLIRKPVMTYGFSEDAEYRAVNVEQHGTNMNFDVLFPETKRSKARRASFTINMPGRHNVENALASIVVADQLGVPADKINAALSQFSGVGRRFQNRGWVKFDKGLSEQANTEQFELIEDYAHHPTELAATIAGAKGSWPERRIVVVFQPHRYSRTRDLFDDFCQVLTEVDVLLITEVYPAGEKPIIGADGKSLCKGVRARSHLDPIFVEGTKDINKMLKAVVNDGDLVLFLGAGDIGSNAVELEAKGQL